MGSAIVFVIGLLQLQFGITAAFSAGEPIDVYITADEELSVPLEGVNTAAMAVSMQQCTGDSYLRMNLQYNGSTLYNRVVTTNQCNRLIASATTASEESVSHDQLCAFRSSADVSKGYTEWSATINDTSLVNPSALTLTFANEGEVPVSAQVVLFTEDYPAPSVDSSIDRVRTEVDLDENTFNIDVSFQASAANDEDSFCATDSGCALYGFYIEEDDNDGDADLDFATSCQALGTGTLAYENIITTESTATLATSSFTTSVCIEFPQKVEATYRVYLVVSPDTTSYARVGYGIQDQLILAADGLFVDGDSDNSCPEDGDTEEDNSATGLRRMRIMPVKATGAMAVTLAAAAAARGF